MTYDQAPARSPKESVPESRRCTVFKRLVAAASVSAVALLGFVPAASAAPQHHTKIVKVIDWDAPSPTAPGGASTHAIDWD